MLVLLDQGTPIGIRSCLSGHTVKTARQQGWDTLLNGELLRVAEESGFDVFVTPDQNLIYQQNLRDRKLAIVVLAQNRWKLVQSHLGRIAEAVNRATAGSYIVVRFPER